MADCQETLNELHRYLDEELSAGRAQEIVEHLKKCTDCFEAFEFHAVLKQTIREKAQKEELDDDFIERLKGCFGDEILGGDGDFLTDQGDEPRSGDDTDPDDNQKS